jgi:hypothetical protein
MIQKITKQTQQLPPTNMADIAEFVLMIKMAERVSNRDVGDSVGSDVGREVDGMLVGRYVLGASVGVRVG